MQYRSPANRIMSEPAASSDIRRTRPSLPAVAWLLLLGAALLTSCAGPSSTGWTGTTGSSKDTTGAKAPSRPGPSADRRAFRVQLRLAEAKSAADAAVGRAVAWFEDLPRDQRPPALAGAQRLPVETAWQPPYYRVYVGPFGSRERARGVLEAIRETFPDAFLAPVPASPSGGRTPGGA
jgi:hypothetical protein